MVTLRLACLCVRQRRDPPDDIQFRGGSDGLSPEAAPIFGSGGVLYGTTLEGGDTQGCNGFGCGTAYSLTPPASGGAWTKAILWVFGGTGDGIAPSLGLTLGSGGVLYGVTEGGGTGACTGGCGAAFSLTPPVSVGGSWTETVLYSFAGGSDGAGPTSGLAMGPGGVLYGTTDSGGASNWGTVFSLTPPTSAGGAWTETVLCSFQGGGDDGAAPSSVTIGPNGVLYGVTLSGGSKDGAGTVFALSPPSAPNGNWVQRVLYRFDGRNGGGAENPLTNLVGSGGALYGTTGGIPTVFSLAPPATAGGAWTETVLCPSSVLGSNQPSGSLVMSPATGIIFGASPFGGSSQACGSSGCGTVWALKPPASAGAAWTFAVLHNFESTDGSLPFGGVTGVQGALYGATSSGGTYGAGTVFAIVE